MAINCFGEVDDALGGKRSSVTGIKFLIVSDIICSQWLGWS